MKLYVISGKELKKFISSLLIFFIFSSTLLYGFETDETLFTRGLNYYIQREFKKAAEEWKKILDRNPTHARAKIYMEKAFLKYNAMEINFYKGLDKFNQEKYAEAIPFFKKTLMINPRHKKAIYYLELCYKLLQKKINKKEVAKETKKEADKYLQEEEFTKAVALYKITILLNPDDEDAKLKLLETEKKLEIANRKLELNLHLQAAREYHQKEKYLLAIQEWSKALIIDPKNKEAKEGLKLDKKLLAEQQRKEKINSLISKGIDQFINMKFTEAKETFLQVLSLDKNNPTAKKYLKKIEKELQKEKEKELMIAEALKHLKLAKFYYNKKRYNDALNEVNITLEVLPDNKEAQELKKKILLQLQKLKELEIKKNQLLAEKLLQEGIKNYKLGEYNLAIDNFNEVLKIDKDNIYAKEYIKLAREALLLQAQSVLNEDSPYYVIIKNLEEKGIKNLKRKNYNIAIQYFKQILELFPLNKNAQILYLKALYKLEPQKVKDILEKHYEKGIKLYKQKNYQKAIYEFSIVEKINSRYKKVKQYIYQCKHPTSLYEKQLKKHFNLGLYYYSKKKYKKAIEEWEKVVNIDKSPLSNKYLGDALANISKAKFRLKGANGKTVSLNEIERKSNKNYKLIQKHYYMGVAYYSSGDYKKALHEWQTVLKYDPTHALALKNIKKCKKRLRLLKK